MIATETRFRIEDMRAFALEAQTILGDRDAEAVKTDRLRELALVRLVEIVGEAASKVPEDARGLAPDVPWRTVVGMRNLLIHGYGVVRIETVVATVRHDFPNLVAALNVLLGEPSK